MDFPNFLNIDLKNKKSPFLLYSIDSIEYKLPINLLIQYYHFEETIKEKEEMILNSILSQLNQNFMKKEYTCKMDFPESFNMNDLILVERLMIQMETNYRADRHNKVNTDSKEEARWKFDFFDVYFQSIVKLQITFLETNFPDTIETYLLSEQAKELKKIMNELISLKNILKENNLREFNKFLPLALQTTKYFDKEISEMIDLDISEERLKWKMEEIISPLRYGESYINYYDGFICEYINNTLIENKERKKDMFKKWSKINKAIKKLRKSQLIKKLEFNEHARYEYTHYQEENNRWLSYLRGAEKYKEITKNFTDLVSAKFYLNLKIYIARWVLNSHKYIKLDELISILNYIEKI